MALGREALDKAEKCAKMAVKLCTDNAACRKICRLVSESVSFCGLNRHTCPLQKKASEQGTSEILGSSLCSLSQARRQLYRFECDHSCRFCTLIPQVHMLRSKYKEALSIGQEAVQVFVKTGHKRNQAT